MMRELFGPPIRPEEVSPLVLAYLGDAVYELLVRQHLVGRGPEKVKKLHQEAVKYVRADTQAKVLHALEPSLTPAERDVVRRGRNAKSGHIPKNASVAEYRHSTGFEGLVGYLYLTRNYDQLREIINLADCIIREG